MSLKVIYPGGHTCIVDMGRYRCRKYGVPLSGPMDIQSALRSQSLVGNPSTYPVIETFMSGLTIETQHPGVRFGVAGATVDIFVNNDLVKDDKIELAQGDRLRIGKVQQGTRTYLSIRGKISVSTVLDSASPLKGYHDTRLAKGDLIDILVPQSEEISKGRSLVVPLSINADAPIIVTPGPEWEQLSESDKVRLENSNYTIDKHADRMGYRLLDPGHKIESYQEIYSSPVMPGTVQLLPSGTPLILMKDCQTTGGYPRIFQVTSESMLQLAQRRPGDEISFQLRGKRE